ncbi:hypothetical protein AB6A40_007767 [Gnathostoma spinigerum]|uniref:Myosin heavy chain n=1 Tax=Gnathostoma spinigerum TaxID=75299 RepID=A0ABD6EVI5_9BILA
MKNYSSEAVVTIQTNIRSFIEVTTWQWNRLFRQVRQLIPLNRDKKKVEELEEEKRLLIAKIKEMEEQLRNTNSLLRLAEAKIKSLKDEKEVCEAGNEELKMELHRHEQVMEIMEKRFDEQHAKVMRIHSCLRDNERKLERIEEEKKELENEVNKWKDKYNIENVKRIGIEHDHEQCESIQQELETKLDKINEEREKETEQYRQFDLKLGEMKKKIEEQSKTIAEQNRSICQLNENLAKKESIVSNEKRNRKKIEAEKSELSAEITRLKEMAAKESVKISTMEETCRDKDRQIRRLQQKIDESNDNMTRNIEELKKIHRESKQELQEKIDELKSTNRRLESENRALKLKADAVSERESSIESDYVGYRSSRMNNRQFSYGSLSSTGSLSSYRSFSHRRTTEPDLRLFHHTDSGIEQMTMSRCSSQSQLANERKIAQLERQLQSAHTDNQIQKREIEVYKSNISQSERDRETLSRKVRTLMSEINTLERSLGEQTERADSLESKYKKVQNDLQNMKNKYENSVRESQSELLELRKNMRLKIDEAIRKNENARSREYDSDQQICDLRDELDDLKRQLERANKQIAQAENLRKSQEKYGETWENQYRIAISELQSLRDENANLKSKIRRQYREVELLTQQSKVGDEVAKLETRFDFQTESQSDSERSDAISDPR